MSLSDVMGAADFSLFAQIGLVISLAAFAGVVAWTLRRSREEMDARARSVLDDDPDGAPAADGARRR